MNAFLVAWRIARWLPMGVIRAVCALAGWWGWLTRAKGARRLEANLAAATGLSGRPLRRLTRQGMASTSRYYAEVLEAPRITPEVIDARVRMDGWERVRSTMSDTTGTVAVLGHLGNWDLVGAYASRNVIQVTAVAEVLKPKEVFEEFLEMRHKLGMRILGHEGGSTFRELIRRTKTERTLVCLLSDRDLSGSGVVVRMWGKAIKVAPGPAALSQATGAPLVPVWVHYERLRGAQRRAAKSRWGTVMVFGEPLWPADFTGDDKVAAMSQAWADQFAPFVTAHAEDWHVLQRLGWVDES